MAHRMLERCERRHRRIGGYRERDEDNMEGGGGRRQGGDSDG